MNCLILTFNSFNSATKVTSHHLADYLLSCKFKVLYVSDAVSPFHLIKLNRFRVNLKRIIISTMYPIDYNQKYISLTPFALLPVENIFPFNTKLFVKLHVDSFSRRFQKIINNFLGIHESFDLIWINNPKFYKLTEKLKYKKLVYSIEDDLFEFSRIPKSLKCNHEKLIQKADLVTVTSQPLLESITSSFHVKSKLMLLRNGVNFNNCLTQYTKIPDEFNSIPEPRIIYVGVISEWFDLELLAKAAISLPNCSFVIIGPVEVSIEALNNIPNIYFLGVKPHSALPAYLQNSQVGIIPFLRNKLIESVNPIKLYEYMAAALPVVSTTWKEIESLGSPAFVAKNNDEFINSIKTIVTKPNCVDRQMLVNFAKSNTWEKRFTELMQVVDL